jgi:hypothetical protein
MDRAPTEEEAITHKATLWLEWEGCDRTARGYYKNPDALPTAEALLLIDPIAKKIKSNKGLLLRLRK